MELQNYPDMTFVKERKSQEREYGIMLTLTTGKGYYKIVLK